jgi:hypothetical protein
MGLDRPRWGDDGARGGPLAPAWSGAPDPAGGDAGARAPRRALATAGGLERPIPLWRD